MIFCELELAGKGNKSCREQATRAAAHKLSFINNVAWKDRAK